MINVKVFSSDRTGTVCSLFYRNQTGFLIDAFKDESIKNFCRDKKIKILFAFITHWSKFFDLVPDTSGILLLASQNTMRLLRKNNSNLRDETPIRAVTNGTITALESEFRLVDCFEFTAIFSPETSILVMGASLSQAVHPNLVGINKKFGLERWRTAIVSTLSKTDARFVIPGFCPGKWSMSPASVFQMADYLLDFEIAGLKNNYESLLLGTYKCYGFEKNLFVSSRYFLRKTDERASACPFPPLSGKILKINFSKTFLYAEFEDEITVRCVGGQRYPCQISDIGWMIFLVRIENLVHIQNWQESSTEGFFVTQHGVKGTLKLEESY